MKIQCQFIRNIDQVDQKDWNLLINNDFPFLRYEFLYALEQSESVSRQTGWEPMHCTIYEQSLLVAVVPQYVKQHSFGEYVFDWSWADAYHNNGLQYYPKLISAIPFTPCTGPRLMVHPEYDTKAIMASFIDACLAQCSQLGFSSWHILFPDKPWSSEQLLQRVGVQFHWYNKGYTSFDDFLAVLSSRKRKNIKKERAKIASQALKFEWREGHDVSLDELKAFYACYHATYLKRGQKGYLNWAFFDILFKSMPQNLLLLLVKTDAPEQTEIVAASLFIKGDQTLYGRYWGALAHFDHLHFEACYYQGIEYCIKHDYLHFDAGAQGEHKVLRGFEPVKTYSYHWLAHPEFSRAVADFLQHERAQIDSYISEIKQLLPYKRL